MNLVKETASSEHELQKQIVSKLRSHGYIVSCNDVFNSLSFVRDVKMKAILKRHLIAMGSTVGFPDITIFKKLKPVFVEIKFRNGKTSFEQDVVHNQLRSQGYEVFIWRTLNECVEWIVKDLNNSNKEENNNEMAKSD